MYLSPLEFHVYVLFHFITFAITIPLFHFDFLASFIFRRKARSERRRTRDRK